MKPKYWFKSIHETTEYADSELKFQPSEIEYLKASIGETFIHTGGTAFWKPEENPYILDIPSLLNCGITHWRVIN